MPRRAQLFPLLPLALAPLLFACGGAASATLTDGAHDASAGGADGGASRADAATTTQRSSAASRQPDAATPDAPLVARVTTLDAGAPSAPSCAPGAWCWENPKPSGEPLAAFWLGSKSDGWGVGGHGTVRRLSSAGWQAFTSPVTWDLTAVWSSGASDLWIGGTTVTSDEFTGGGIAHWDGATWTTVALSDPLIGWLGASGPDDVWILAEGDTATTHVLHGSIGSLKDVSPGGGYSIDSLCVRGAGDVWASAAIPTWDSWPDYLLHWNGAAWSTVYHLGDDTSRFDLGIACGAGSDVWAPVYDFDAGSYSMLRVSSGAAVAPGPMPSSVVADWAGVIDIHAASDGSIILNDQSLRNVYRWPVGASAWVTITPPSVVESGWGTTAVDFAPDGSGWLATGNAELAPWTDGTWDIHGLVARDTLEGLVGGPNGPPTTAVGLGGAMGLRQDGSASSGTATWSFVEPPLKSSQMFGPTWASGPDDVWTAEGGDVLHVVSGQAAPPTLPGAATVIGLAGTSSTDVWALDSLGTLSHTDGTAWRTWQPACPLSTDAGGSFAPVGLWVGPSSDLWVIAEQYRYFGSTAEVLHWNGSTWDTTTIGGDASAAGMRAIAGQSADDLWIAGQGLWHHRRGGTWELASSEIGGSVMSVTSNGVYLLTGGGTPAVTRWDPKTKQATSWPVPVSSAVSIDALWVGPSAAAAADGGTAAGDTIWVGGANESVLSFTP